MVLLLYIVCSYLVGAVPFGYLAGKVNGIDLREHGSKNIGATNAKRVLGRKWGYSVFLLDCAKGFLPVFCWSHYVAPYFYGAGSGDSGWWGQAGIVCTGLAAIIGHIYTCYLHFKGGKGVATTAGVLFAISPFIGVVSLLAWVLVLLVTRYVSIASIAASIVMILVAAYERGFFSSGLPWWRPEILVVLFLVFVSVLVIVKHKSNLVRICQGTEPKAFSKKDQVKP